MTNKMIRFTGLRAQWFQLRVVGRCVFVRRNSQRYKREESGIGGLMGLEAKQFHLRWRDGRRHVLGWCDRTDSKLLGYVCDTYATETNRDLELVVGEGSEQGNKLTARVRDGGEMREWKEGGQRGERQEKARRERRRKREKREKREER